MMSGKTRAQVVEQARSLPVAKHRDALTTLIKGNRCAVVLGETGSGKTTQLPQFLLDDGVAGRKPIVVTQPRRVAAISVAERVSQERGTKLGDEVGYHVRFDKCFTQHTRIKYVTDGVLLRECLESPTLDQYGIVILDEAHIRSLETDILFGLLKKNIVEQRKGPKLVVMSATLQAEKFKEFFRCEQYEVPGRLHPIKIKHCNLTSAENYSNYASHCADVALQIHQNKPQGDILIFLTGRAEIEDVCDEIFALGEGIDYAVGEVKDPDVRGLLVLPVYGSMTSRAQQRIFEPAPPGVRKVVVATEIASTSLTVDGVVYVVDAGFVKQNIYNPRTGLDSLKVVPISKAEAKQRAGRAGRTKPGECYRIYDIDFEDTMMPEHTVPEIQRSSLASVVLTLKCLGIDDVLRFDYLDAPEEYHLLEALRQLFFFDAIDATGKVTKLGRLMSSFPLAPSLARVLLHARLVDLSPEHIDDLVALVAMLSSETPFHGRSEDRKQEMAECAGDDFNLLLYIFRCAEKLRGDKRMLRNWCFNHHVHFRVVNSVGRIHEQLLGILTGLSSRAIDEAAEGVADRLLDKERREDEAKLEKEGKSKARRREEPGQWRMQPLRRGSLPPIDEETRCVVRRALCFGLFNNIARRSEEHNYFLTMEGNASVVLVHPSSMFFGEGEEQLKWVIFHQVLWTNKPYMHVLTPIEYEWVKRLLPKLRKVEVRQLSTTGELSKAAALEVSMETRKAKQAVSKEDFGKRRNDTDAVQSARERYLARKRAKRAGPI